ncbi:hypothetical protein CFVI92203_09245 [Campylobacter fetus subsp. venerealis cfvi92/203]|nr:hypothetical protein CFVI92203_09245 [Campylobacter fetus subsp. venerealis cfvi92/203]
MFPKIIGFFLTFIILIISGQIILMGKDSINFEKILPVIGLLFVVIITSALVFNDVIEWDTNKFKGFVSNGFNIILGFCSVIFILLKMVLAYKFYKSKDIYYITNNYIKAFNNKNLKYFIAENFIDPKDMGRNMAKFFV